MSPTVFRFKRLSAWTCVLFLLCFVLQVQLSAAQVAVIACTADTSISQQNTNNNLGGMNFLPTGCNASGSRLRALCGFTITNVIPAGSVIRSATLEVEIIEAASEQNVSFSVHRLLKSWGEGNKTGGTTDSQTFGAAAQTGEATWSRRLFPNTAWSAPGGSSGNDFFGTASAATDITGIERYAFTSSALASDVQMWLDNPGTNFGWLIKATSEATSSTTRMFGSREDAGAAPVLRVEYILPNAAGPSLHNIRWNAGSIHFDFVAAANRMYIVEYSTSFGTWLLHSLVPPGAARIVTVTDPITPENRFYRVVVL